MINSFVFSLLLESEIILNRSRKKYIRNCPVTIDDAKRPLHIYGPDIANLQGKTRRSGRARIPTTKLLFLPEEVIRSQKIVC